MKILQRYLTTVPFLTWWLTDKLIRKECKTTIIVENGKVSVKKKSD